MGVLFCLVNFNDADSCSGATPIFLLNLFKINEKSFLGLLFKHLYYTYHVGAFLQVLQDCLSAFWYFDHF